MNQVVLMGRLTRDPDVRYTTNTQNEQLCIARYTLAVDRRGKDNGTDFISCVAFGKAAEFVEKYLHQGTKMVVTGRLQTGSYTNKEGNKVYTTDVVIEGQEFAESKKSESAQDEKAQEEAQNSEEGFMSIPEGATDDLPFKNH